VMVLSPSLLLAQNATCNGTLGEAVVKIDFGTIPGAKAYECLPPGFTQYFCNTGSNGLYPEGTYRMVSRVDLTTTGHPAFSGFTRDHTGNPGGAMMAINGDRTHKICYQMPIDQLCLGTQYEFSAWVGNMVPNATINDGPKINFVLKNQNGANVMDVVTPTVITPQGVWTRVSALVTLTQPFTSLQLQVWDITTAAAGNDFVLDDIEFRACGPSISLNRDDVRVCEGDNYTITSTIGTVFIFISGSIVLMVIRGTILLVQPAKI